MTADAIKSHTILLTLNDISEILLNDRFSQDFSTNTDIVSWNREKISAFCNLLLSGIDKSPSTLISIHGLNSLNGTLQQVKAELINFTANGNIAHLQGAVNVLDQGAYNTLWAVPVVQSELRIAEAFKDGEQFRLATVSLIDKLNDERTQWENSLVALKTEGAQHHKQLMEMQDLVTKERQSIITVSAEVKTAYAKLENELQKRYEYESSEILAAFNIQLTQEKNEFSEWLEKRNVESGTLLNDISEKQKEAAKIVQIVGNIGVTGNYQKMALKEGRAASFWRAATILFFLISIGIVIFALTSLSSGQEWHFALIRLLAAITLTAPAYYTARESARHRTTADSANRAELELASLGPFIQSLPEAEQAVIRKDLAKKYFGQTIKDHEIKDMYSLKDLKAISDIFNIDGKK